MHILGPLDRRPVKARDALVHELQRQLVGLEHLDRMLVQQIGGAFHLLAQGTHDLAVREPRRDGPQPGRDGQRRGH